MVRLQESSLNSNICSRWANKLEVNTPQIPLSKRRKCAIEHYDSTLDLFSFCLNRDLKVVIFSQLTIEDVTNLCLVCRDWRNVVRNSSVLFKRVDLSCTKRLHCDVLLNRLISQGFPLVISEIDLTGCWNLNEDHLQSLLDANQGILKKLNLSESHLLPPTGTKHFDSLTHYYIVSNDLDWYSRISILDCCSKSIEEIDISNNGRYSTPKFHKKYKVAPFYKVRTLKMRWCELSDDTLDDIVQIFPNLIVLDLSFCASYGRLDFIKYAQRLQMLRKLIIIDCGYRGPIFGYPFSIVSGTVTLDIAQELIKSDDLYINCNYFPGATVNLLTHSMISGKYKLFEWLLKRGANPNFIVDGQQTTLSCAISLYLDNVNKSIDSDRYYLTVIKALLENGSTLRLPYHYGALQPLEMACTAGDTLLIKLLLHYETDKNHINNCLLTTLSHKGFRPHIAELLFSIGAKMPTYDIWHYKFLESSSYLIDLARIRKVFDNGYTITVKELIQAANYNDIEFIEKVLKTFRKELFQKKPISDWKWNKKITRFFDTTEAFINLYGTVKCNVKCIKDLLIEDDHFPDFEEIDEDGNTWLHRNITMISLATIPIAVENGTPINLQNKDGNTIAHMLLLNKLINITKEEYEKAILYFIDKGLNLNLLNHDNQSILLLVIKFRLTFLYRKVMDVSVINVVDINGESPLMIAVRRGDTQFTYHLLRNGANPSLIHRIGDEMMTTPLHLAVANYDPSEFSTRFTIIKQLVDYGADCNCKDHNGMTPMQIARDNNYIDVLTLLQSKQK